jgi:sterol desaturase/sphingolipid hydroxylase (fatty acid hydroxylase superfamily)
MNYLPVALTWMEGFGIEISRYFVSAAIVFGVISTLGVWTTVIAKIRPDWPKPRQYFREAANSFRSLIVYFSVAVSMVLIVRQFPLPNFAPQVLTEFTLLGAIAMLLAHDAYFYWTHRALHHPRFFRFHAEHHRSLNPSPWAAYSFSTTEAAIQGAFLPLYACFVPVSDTLAAFFMTFQVVSNAIGHSGFEFYPRLLVSNRWTGWITGTTHHDMHHATFNTNYGLYFRIWDRLMGTEHPKFLAIFAHVRSPANARDGYALYLRPGANDTQSKGSENTADTRLESA